VVASVHSRFRLGVEAMTARLVRAVSHPSVTFLGHPTGRLLLAREGYAFDEGAVLDAAFAHGVVIELNASPNRLDVDWRVLRGWLARGGRTSVHPDAHAPAGLDDAAYGVAMARRRRAAPGSGQRRPAEEVAGFVARRARAASAAGRGQRGAPT
jgi:DNA polymerase (family 10)